MEVVLYIILGSVTGVAAGILGIGGGLVIVPGLAMIFKYYCGYTNEFMHLAAGTSLSIMIFTAISAVRTNHKQKRIVWPIFKRTVPWIILGDIIGAFTAGCLSAATLSLLFGLVILSLAIKMIISLLKSKNQKEEEKEEINIHKLISAIVGTIIGLKSGLFGIGGGAISVPYLNSFGLPMKKATGTSSAFTLPVSIVGTICFICTGIFYHTNIPYSIGYVNWAASLIIIPFTMYFAHIGCLISNRMPTKWLRVAFILFLLFVSCKMLL